VVTLENWVYKITSSTIRCMKDILGRHLYDMILGPGCATSIGVQWQNGKLVGVWPTGWKPAPGVDVTHKAMKSIKILPWTIRTHKK
jgi:hypothetical protein